MRPWYRFCRFGCRMYLTSLHFGRVLNRPFVPLDGAALLVSNHQSFLDPVLLTYGLNREGDYMARESLFRIPGFEKLIRSLNAFPVNRDEVTVSEIKETLRRLKAGRMVTVFPEGTRTRDGRIGEFKSGFIRLARMAKVPIIPAAIDGAFEAWPRTSPLPKPLVPVRICYGRLLSLEYLQAQDAERMEATIRRQIIDLQHHLRRLAGKSLYNYPEMHDEHHSR